MNFKDEQCINDGKSSFVFDKFIKFKNVSFSFNDKKVLDDITFSFKKNSINTIVGPSGVGKTTIIDLLLKIYEPDDGEIFVDEKIISDISKEELRNSISFLPQDLLILNTNIFENIDLYGKNISHQKLIREIDSMKLGLNKLEVESAENIGYGGINLSGGQKQKINILRTILKDSNFIIFDEPTNNLDQESINIFVNQL